MLVTCPSGLSFYVRPWNLGDNAALLDSVRDESTILTLKMLEISLTQSHPGVVGVLP